MDPEKDEQKQDDQELKGLSNILKTGAKKVKNVFSMIFKKIIAVIGIPLLIKLVFIMAIIAGITCALSWLFNLHSNNVITDVASTRILKSEVSIASNDEGYYFKLNEEALDKYLEELNKAYQEGYFHMNFDDEYLKDNVVYDPEDRPVTDRDVYDWFESDDYKHYFIRMVRAEIASSYPKLGNYQGENGTEDKGGNKKDKDNDYVAQGVVKIHRTKMNQDGTVGEEIELTYLPHDVFSSMVAANDPEALNFFSFDPDKQLIYYAVYTETVVTVNGVETSRVFTLREESASYKAVVSMCSMPYNFLFSLLQESGNPEWIMAVIDLLLQKTDVIFMIQDQLSITAVTETTDRATKTEVTSVSGSGGSSTSTSVSYPAPGSTTVTVTTTYTNTANVFIKKAYTWCMDFEQEAIGPNLTESSQETTYDYPDPGSLCTNLVSSTTSDVSEDGSYTITTVYSSDDLLESVKVDTKNYTWTIQLVKKEINTKLFLGTWKNDTGKYYVGSLYDPDGKEIKYRLPDETRETGIPPKQLSDASEQKIDIVIGLLSKHENTQLHEQLMMYFWNVYVGKNIYDVSVDEILDLINTNVTTSFFGSSIENYIKAWENGSIWKYETGASSVVPTSYMSADGQYYIVYEDGSAGHNNVSYGLATFITNSRGTVTHPQYGLGYYNWQSQFSAHGVDVTTLKTGDLVPVDAANAVFSEVLGTFESKVDSYLSSHGLTLSQNQRDALVAICYQYGNINGFAEAYNKSLNSNGEVDPELIKNNFILTSNNNSKPFNYSSTRNDRKYANWLLFTEGTYIDRSGDVIQVMGGSILECAKMIHDYMSDPAHLYYYCLIGGESDRQVHINAGLSCGLNSSFQASQQPGNNGYRLTCCATYVSWVLEEAGYLQTHTNGSKTLKSLLVGAGWTPVGSYSELQAGDVVFMDTDGPNNGNITHVQLYVGDGKWYNAGGNWSIHQVAPYSDNASAEYVCAYRAPN